MNIDKIYHPVLFAIYPILSLYAANIYFDPSLWHMVIVLLVLAVGASFLLFLFINLFLKNKMKSGLIASIFIILFYSYGRLYDLEPIERFLENFNLAKIGIPIGPYLTLLFVFGAIFLICLYFIFKFEKYNNLMNNSLNFFSLSLVVLALCSIGVNFYDINIKYNDPGEQQNVFLNVGNGALVGNGSLGPDIYYIILDEYASESTLKDFGYDNHDFLEFLRNKGFYVANSSQCNHGADNRLKASTVLSLASSLNMNYLNNLDEMNTTIQKGKLAPYKLIQDNRVMRFLKSKGYTTINIGSSWGPTAFNNYADINFVPFILFGSPDQNEFIHVYMKTTMLRPFGNILLNHSFYDPQRVLYAFSKLENNSEIGHPKFVFAHIVSPHPPYIFDRNGEFISINAKSYDYRSAMREPYINQLIFINKKLMNLVNKLIDGPDNYPKIIIIQSDHGLEFQENKSYENRSHQKMFKHGMTILNAYYFPNNDYKNLYDNITPVNTFRIVFNSYFNTSFELLNDTNYYYKDQLYLIPHEDS